MRQNAFYQIRRNPQSLCGNPQIFRKLLKMDLLTTTRDNRRILAFLFVLYRLRQIRKCFRRIYLPPKHSKQRQKKQYTSQKKVFCWVYDNCRQFYCLMPQGLGIANIEIEKHKKHFYILPI